MKFILTAGGTGGHIYPALSVLDEIKKGHQIYVISPLVEENENNDLYDVEKLKESLNKIVNKDIFINIKEVKKPQSNAQLAAESVATQLERRIAFRRAMKKVMQGAIKSGAKGIKVRVSGRLAGAEMARTEWYMEGRIPLHTLRAKIDYGFAEALTTYGNIGVKVWIFKGEVLQKGIQAEKQNEEGEEKPSRPARKRRGQ